MDNKMMMMMMANVDKVKEEEREGEREKLLGNEAASPPNLPPSPQPTSQVGITRPQLGVMPCRTSWGLGPLFPQLPQPATPSHPTPRLTGIGCIYMTPHPYLHVTLAFIIIFM